jgi:hypothetical protein
MKWIILMKVLPPTCFAVSKERSGRCGKLGQNPSTLEQDVLEIVLLLETSIWKIFDHDLLYYTTGSLQDAIEVIISIEEETQESTGGVEGSLAGEPPTDSNPRDNKDVLDAFPQEFVPCGSMNLSFEDSERLMGKSGCAFLRDSVFRFQVPETIF